MSTEAQGGEHVAVRPRRIGASLSIKSLILLMLLVVSVGSNVVVGIIGYLNGSDSLTDAAYDRLTEVRDSRSREVASLFDSVESSLLLASHDSAVVDAEQAFASSVAELATASIASDAVAAADPASTSDAPGVLTGEQDAAVSAYFADDFGPRLEEATGEPADADSFAPTSAAARYLIYHYLIAPDDADESSWGSANDRYGEYLDRMADLLRFDDLLLIDSSGRVVYSVAKGVDLGADLVEGPYSLTSLGTAVDTAMSTNQGLDTVVFSDFKRYSPALGRPVAWAVVPLAGEDQVVGAIAVQLPVDRINEVMTGGGQWTAGGLGASGEAYLVCSDFTMRSVSRDLQEDPQAYADAAIDAGLSPEDADEAVASGQTLLLQQVNTEAARLGMSGKSGTVTSGSYLGSQTIAAYAPFRSHNLQWAIVAEIDADEALAPVNEFTKRLALSSAIIVAIVSLISVIIAGLAVRPLRRLRDAARRIAAGEQGVQVEAGESDELADVAAAFNDMSRSLELKASLIEEQRAENDRLIRTLMPENLAKRYREGVRTIVEDHQEVTVLFADIVGFEEFGRKMTSDRALDILNDIFRAFDEAADLLGVERVRTTRQGYLASCGLSVPRVDHARRCVEFAIEMQRIVERFGAQQGADLSVRVGMDTGTVTSGLVGRSHVVYDLWGDAVSLAFRLQGGANEAGVFLTQRVVDKLPDTLPYADSGVVETSGGFQRVWRIDPRALEHVAP